MKISRFFRKLENKVGKYTIPNIIRYVLVLYLLGAFIGLLPGGYLFYYQYLSLDFNAIFHGQVWRLFTFVITPNLPEASSTGAMDLISLFFFVYLYYLIGTQLEQVWGSFRMNLFIYFGLFFNLLAGLFLFLVTGDSYSIGFSYLFQSMFFAYAMFFPDQKFLLFFLIPIKVKYLAIFDGIFLILQVGLTLLSGSYAAAFAIVLMFANFIIFWLEFREYRGKTFTQKRRKQAFQKAVKRPANAGATRHKCSICGRTELDGDDLEFRYCSKCKGNHEYCRDHLFTHTHIK
ncbi:MAG: rhomboid family intramembrane serine protease [Clostridiales bacterium]|nr:rhomboid family intramembrane serine protease [Clostridiales bacterium]